PIGRTSLAKELRLGIASTRTLIKRLRELGIVDVDLVGGCYLTKKGREIVDTFFKYVKTISDLSNVVERDLKLANYAYGALLRLCTSAESISIVEWRDIFVRYGAKATLIAKIINGKAILPPDENIGENVYPSLRKVREKFNAEEGDYIVITFSDTLTIAEESLIKGLIDILPF
ncbi:MAG TPA: DUF4443 domain-containing protein, partial [Ignisphaera sp.]|nr:DUF4443 domain-containing protein [Ignisphaera sp.]